MSELPSKFKKKNTFTLNSSQTAAKIIAINQDNQDNQDSSDDELPFKTPDVTFNSSSMSNSAYNPDSDNDRHHSEHYRGGGLRKKIEKNRKKTKKIEKMTENG